MKEIKFRLWNRLGQNMGEVSRIDFVESGEHWVYDGSETMFSFEECDLMQYTGLKDKNGKEIYEGDIVHVVDDNVLAPDEYLQRVEMANGCWRPTMMFVVGNSVEVVGNIYETPNLLT